MKAVILKCKPGFQFHFGEYAPDTDTALNHSASFIHSDTLFSAIVRTYNDLYEDTNEFVKQFETGNILISSAFFCMKVHERFIWFLPKPVSFNLIETSDYKSVRRINFISKKLWETLTKPDDLINSADIVIVQEEFAVHKDELSGLNDSQIKNIKIYRNHTTPKVLVHSMSMEDSLYQLDRIEIADINAENENIKDKIEIHYYFLFKENKEFEKEFSGKFLKTIQILAANGIGGERSTIGELDGAEILDEWTIKENKSNYFATTSMLSPNKVEFDNLLFYKTIFRGGRRVGNNIGYSILKTARLITEGAILNQDIKGEVLDISPENSKYIYKRNGKSLNLSIPKTWII